jgi:hypothetical protein
MKNLLVSLSLLALTACATQPVCPPADKSVIAPISSPAPVATPGPSASPPPAASPVPSPVALPDDADDMVLAWEEKYPENHPWSVELRRQINAHLGTFEKATDWKSFCPKWDSLTQKQEVNVIATMAVWIAYYECDWNSKSDAPDVGSTNSVGLFQLSYEDNMKWCPMSAAKKNLTDGIVNIQCAIPEMAYLIEEDGLVVASGAKADFLAKPKRSKGLSLYWSTMWTDGKKPQIQAKVKALPFCN